MQSHIWTDERIEILRRRWLEGMSASQIAKELGEGVTRNAVIGKVHRMGFAGRALPQQAKAAESETKAPAAEAAPSAPEPQPVRGAVVAIPSRDAAAHAPQRSADAGRDGVVVPIAKRLPIEKLTERTCKWPIGDPGHPDFHFCGHDSLDGLPYCRYHASVAYQAADPRRRAGGRFAFG